MQQEQQSSCDAFVTVDAAVRAVEAYTTDPSVFSEAQISAAASVAAPETLEDWAFQVG
jgi:hypothetical protein